MTNISFNKLARLGSIGVGAIVALGAVPAQAAPVLTTINQNIQNSPYEFCFMDGCFNFSARDFTGFGEILGVSTSGGAAVTATAPIFGSVAPSVSFTNRGTVQYGPPPEAFGYYSSFENTTYAKYSTNENFLGLRVTSGGQDYYGFAFTTNQTLNGIGFETAPGTTITATTDFATGAVPEPGVWAMMLIGFGALGAMQRSAIRKKTLRVAYG